MRDREIDMWETLFIALALFASLISTMSPYLAWLVAIALGIQLFDFATSPDHLVDFVVLALLALVAVLITNLCPAIASLVSYESWALFFALVVQLYDDYSS